MKFNRFFLILSIIVLLSGTACQLTPALQPPDPAQEAVNSTQPHPWWQDAVFYEVFVRSFQDSDGDGVGDFNGLRARLDYLNDGNPETNTDLGITALWLMPIFPSPSYHGYDVINYQAVNPDYGSMADFKALLQDCHERGIHVIIDFVINHTSSQHPWFQASKDPQSSFRDWYVWSATRPTQAGPWGQNAWVESDGAYYYAPFWSGMPDLNYRHPMVTRAIYNATDFWLELGVDGFRVDAARYLFEDGPAQQDTAETIQWFQDWFKHVHSVRADAFTVAEVWTDTQVIARYDQPTAGMNSYFMFDLAENLLGSVYSPDPARAIKAYQDSLNYFPTGQFSSFLSNHDQPRVGNYYKERLFKEKLAAFLYLTGPGIPFIYYGEEIGMTGSKPDELIRTPMQWSAETQAGFSSGEPWQTINKGWEERNVALQDADSASLLTWYRQLVHLRNAQPALRTGSYLPLSSSCRSLYAVLRVQGDEALLLLANLGIQELESCTLTLEGGPLKGNYRLQALHGQAPSAILQFDESGNLNTEQLVPRMKGGETAILQLTHQ